MIHRQNYLDVHAYLRYCMRGRQVDEKSVARYRAALRHLLEWADETPLPKARNIDPVLPAYLLTARCDGRAKPLSPASLLKSLQCARTFFAFARSEWPTRYRPVSASWIGQLQPPRGMRSESRLVIHQFYTLDAVRQVAAVAVETLREARAQVAICMLFLSGMRADALASLPISCVDLAARAVSQLPEAGVRTKNRKAAITYLLDIPDLLNVIRRWDARVRAAHPADALWYASLSGDGMTILPTLQACEGRNKTVADDVKLICARAGLPYLSPHKLRHGHVVHALKQARNMAELKAISQNVMHGSVTITNQVYGGLAGEDVRSIIAGLGKGSLTPSLEEKVNRLLTLLDLGI